MRRTAIGMTVSTSPAMGVLGITLLLICVNVATANKPTILNDSGAPANPTLKLVYDTPYTVQVGVASNYLLHAYSNDELLSDTSYTVTMSIDDKVTPSVCSSANLPQKATVEGLGVALFMNVVILLPETTDHTIVSCPVVFSLGTSDAGSVPYTLAQTITVQLEDYAMRLVSPLRLMNGESATYTVLVLKNQMPIYDLATRMYLTIAAAQPTCTLSTKTTNVALSPSSTAEFLETTLTYGSDVQSCDLMFELYEGDVSVTRIRQSFPVVWFRMELIQPESIPNNLQMDYVVNVQRDGLPLLDTGYTVTMTVDDVSSNVCTLAAPVKTSVSNSIAMFNDVVINVHASDSHTTCILHFELHGMDTTRPLYIQDHEVHAFADKSPILKWTYPFSISFGSPVSLNLSMYDGNVSSAEMNFKNVMNSDCTFMLPNRVSDNPQGKFINFGTQVITYPRNVHVCVFEFTMYDSLRNPIGAKQLLSAPTTHLDIRWIGPYTVQNDYPTTYNLSTTMDNEVYIEESLVVQLKVDRSSMATCAFTSPTLEAKANAKGVVEFIDLNLRTTDKSNIKCKLLVTIMTQQLTFRWELLTKQQIVVVENSPSPITVSTQYPQNILNAQPFDVDVFARRGDAILSGSGYAVTLSIAPTDTEVCSFTTQPPRTPVNEESGSAKVTGVALRFRDGVTVCKVEVTLVRIGGDAFPDVSAASVTMSVYRIDLSVSLTSAAAIPSGSSADLTVRVLENGNGLKHTGLTASIADSPMSESMCSLGKPAIENVAVGPDGAVTFPGMTLSSSVQANSTAKLLCGVAWRLTLNAVDVATGTLLVTLQLSETKDQAPVKKAADRSYTGLYVMLTLILLVALGGGLYFWRRRRAQNNQYSKDLYVNH